MADEWREFNEDNENGNERAILPLVVTGNRNVSLLPKTDPDGWLPHVYVQLTKEIFYQLFILFHVICIDGLYVQVHYVFAI